MDRVVLYECQFCGKLWHESPSPIAVCPRCDRVVVVVDEEADTELYEE